jgi:hypothetical protein
MSQSERIDAYGTDVAVLIAVFFLQWMHKPTSVTAICSYFQGDLLKPDAVKDSLLRLQNGKALVVLKSGRGTTPVYSIQFSELNTYFYSAIASSSTQYRSFQKLEDIGLARYSEGKYFFSARGLLSFLTRSGISIEQSLKLLTDWVSVSLQRPIPQISEQQFVDLLDGREFSLDGRVISFSNEILQICQKALSSPTT